MARNTVLRVVAHPLQTSTQSENSEVCDTCGETYFVGQWPLCPHGTPGLVTEKSYPFTTKNFTGQPIEVTSRAHERALCAQYGVVKRDDVAWVEKTYQGYDPKTKQQVYKEGNGVGLPGCWI